MSNGAISWHGSYSYSVSQGPLCTLWSTWMNAVEQDKLAREPVKDIGYCATTTWGTHQSVSTLSRSLRGSLEWGHWQTSEKTLYDKRICCRCGRIVGFNGNSWVANLQGHDIFHPECESSRSLKAINDSDRGRQRDRQKWDTHSISTNEHSSVSPFALVEAGVVHNPLSGQCKRLGGKNKCISIKVQEHFSNICNLFRITWITWIVQCSFYFFLLKMKPK